ncbi:MAG: helix-turn-helix transcriptional regulator [Eubacterium sp.]|nr:helix-turn-helix transcriptional regulator [Eubacterium sp.]
MISYEKLWTTMKEKGISQYSLIKHYHVSAGQLSRLRSNAFVSTHTIDMLCHILDCNVEDIMTFSKESQPPSSSK